MVRPFSSNGVSVCVYSFVRLESEQIEEEEEEEETGREEVLL